jgi:hypothetical protein
MPIELIDFQKTYELRHPTGAVFTVKHWTNAMQDEVDRSCVLHDKDKNIFSYDIAREREMKIDLSVVGWKEITADGQEVECTSENKKKLPVGVTLWLQKEIEERAGLRIAPEEKKS